MTNRPDAEHHIRYEADETPPPILTVGLGLQLAILCIAGIVLTPAIVVRAAGGSDAYLSWAVFAAVAISGTTTILQAVRVGRIGSGYVLLMGTSGAFIAVCVTALAKGGPAMLATLVVASSLFQFALAGRLSIFRRILTPTVAGTVIMLIPVTVMPIIFGMLSKFPEEAPAPAAPASALVTMLVILGITLKSRGSLRLWAPVIGVVAGSVIAGFFGLYDFDRIARAAWIGLPNEAWPGLDLEFGSVFWTLLPAFVFVTLIGAIETIGDSVAIQRVSWRHPRAVDYRSVQGAVAADGVGNLLSGLAGTVPNTTYSTSVAVTELTGVSARSIGVVIGVIFIIIAFLPKVLALVLAVPDAVVGAYVTVLLAILFMVGLKMVVQDGADYRKSLIAGIAFWIGVGFQSGEIFPQYFTGLIGDLLQNGMTAGGLVAIILTLAVEFIESRPSRLRTRFDASSLPEIRRFLNEFSARQGWDSKTADRIDAVSEETLLTLLGDDDVRPAQDNRHFQVVARTDGANAVLEFIASTNEENLQDRITLLREPTAGAPVEREVSLRLLRHLASKVNHQQYYGLDIVTVHINVPD